MSKPLQTSTQETNDAPIALAIAPPIVDFDAFNYGPNTRLADLVKALSELPLVYSELGGPWRKAVTCTEAALVIAAQPDIDPTFGFPAALFERLRARLASAATPEERERLEELSRRLTLNSSSLGDLCVKLRRLGRGRAALRHLHQSIGTFLEHLEHVDAMEPSGRSAT